MLYHAMHTADCWNGISIERLRVENISRHALQTDLSLRGTQCTIGREQCPRPPSC